MHMGGDEMMMKKKKRRGRRRGRRRHGNITDMMNMTSMTGMTQ